VSQRTHVRGLQNILGLCSIAYAPLQKTEELPPLFQNCMDRSLCHGKKSGARQAPRRVHFIFGQLHTGQVQKGPQGQSVHFIVFIIITVSL
jgi:hypothetical protein